MWCETNPGVPGFSFGTKWNQTGSGDGCKCLKTRWPGTESNRRRQPFQRGDNHYLQLLTGLREAAKYLQARGGRCNYGLKQRAGNFALSDTLYLFSSYSPRRSLFPPWPGTDCYQGRSQISLVLGDAPCISWRLHTVGSFRRTFGLAISCSNQPLLERACEYRRTFKAAVRTWKVGQASFLSWSRCNWYWRTCSEPSWSGGAWK